jgi:hypothetical protein
VIKNKKTYTIEEATATVGRVVGIPTKESLEILAQVRANHAKLDACERPHDFIQDPPPEGRTLSRRCTCSKCKGSLDTANARWYQKGLEDGAAKGNVRPKESS